MRSNLLKVTLFGLIRTAGLATSILAAASGTSFAQSVTLTAQSSNAVMPDGQTVPMWGYVCLPGSASGGAACAPSNANAGANGWSPVVITVPAGPLTINLFNKLPGQVPTSLTIVGQLGGGLGTSATKTVSPAHPPQVATWPVAGNPASAAAPRFTPPNQPQRVQSFATEVANGGTTATALMWTKLKPGTYLIESGTHPSIQGPMGLYGVLVVTPPATPQIPLPANQAYPHYDADVPLLLSEIDPAQNAAVAKAVVTPGFSETKVWSGQHGQCGDPTSTSYGTCYPPAVNYDPRYYLINGVAFDRTSAAKSQFSVNAPAMTGTTPAQILVRFVNAGLRMHVPSIVGAQTQTSPSAATPATATPGFALIAEDGNVLPGTAKIQNEVFLAAGKTYDVMMNAPAAGAPALPVFDRELSLSTNNQRDGGMQGYISVNGAVAAVSTAGVGTSPVAAAGQRYYFLPNKTLTVSDPAKGVMANSTGIYGVQLVKGPAGAVANGFTLNSDGTFTYTPGPSTTSDSFVYQSTNGSPPAQGTVTLTVCGAGCLGQAPLAGSNLYVSNVASRLQVASPGVLAYASDPSGLAMTAIPTTAGGAALQLNPDGSFNAQGGTVTLNADGSFTAIPSTVPTVGVHMVTFNYQVVNSQNTKSSNVGTINVKFRPGSGLVVNVVDVTTNGKTSPVPITDYRWIIEEDRTFYIDPACQVNNGAAGNGGHNSCPSPVPSLGTNFHTSYMPVVASGCVGQYACESGQTVYNPATNTHVPTVCDIGNGACRTNASQFAPAKPGDVLLDPTKRYYISVLPGDAGNPFATNAGQPVTIGGTTRPFDLSKDCTSFAPGTGNCGHGLGGAPIAAGQAQKNIPVNVIVQPTPLQPAKVAVFVFEDDSPLNGEVDVHGGTDALGSAREPGLGGFEIKLWDDAGGTGDPTGQMSYDMFNMPLSNSLQGTIDPVTGLDACPISQKADHVDPATGKLVSDGLVGMIPTCPNLESDGKTPSPLAGQAIIANLMPGRYGIIATPAADRIARGEQWLQTNTLDGQKAHDSFIKVGEPAYFQEFGPAGFHVSIGFANPKIINDRLAAVCPNPAQCTSSVKGRITNLHYSRPPNENLFGSQSRRPLSFTQCYVSLGETDGDDISFTKCNPDGTFNFSGLPAGTWRVTVFDQWNDQIVDGLARAFKMSQGQALDLGDIAVLQWHTNLYTRTFIDLTGNGVSHDTDPGLAQVPINIRFRDGSYSNMGVTDMNGYMAFNEVFPLFNWYVVDADTTRYKQTGVHVVYDAGGPPDMPTGQTPLPGGTNSVIAANLANTNETVHLPTDLRFPGSVYCSNADCNGYSIKQPGSSSTSPSTGRIDPAWVTTMGWQGFSGQAGFVEFGKTPFAKGENGGVRGEVAYASTRAFDDPTLTVHARWLPNIPNVTVNLYQESTAVDGSPVLKKVDTTLTASWDDWAQGFHRAPPGSGTHQVPNMNCPGQDNKTDPFFFTLQGSTEWLYPDVSMPYGAQFKCYDGMHAFNQLQPAPYDGMYQFPSVTERDPSTGKPTKTNCTVCVANPTGDGTRMLPAGKYVVEVVVPPGYELMKEEDKNILIGDNFIAPVTQQFAGFGNIFIMPDQAAVNSSYNPNSAQNPTTNLGSVTFPRAEGDTGTTEVFWPCVGALRVVPDYLSLFPYAQEVAPFAGASRHLCDRKEITLTDQMSAQAKFYLFSSTHVASHFTGFMLDDFSAEFDPFSPQFGEKFAVPNVPVSIKDFAGNEIERIYSDQWGIFNGLTYSTWEVNPPNPTGYAPGMMVACMNDPDLQIPDPANPGKTKLVRDPLYNPAYSQFCYEIPFMPGQTQYMDTPVVPVQAFAAGYDQPDCAYPDATPAVSTVLGDSANGGSGPWVSAAGHTLTINALGDQQVVNHAYTGPQATTAPFNQKFITRHYGFGTQGTGSSVTISGLPAKVLSWSDSQITVSVPDLAAAPSSCPIQQQASWVPAGTTPAYCGELVITASNGKKSIDAVTVTMGGKAPTYVNGENSTNDAIQQVLDSASPGDLIIVGPGSYSEMLTMWKPVRLQGVGAPSVIVNANTHPSGKLDPWRRRIDCLFGVALNGALIGQGNAYDPSGTYTCSNAMQGQVDPIPFEPIIGWDNMLNGHLAELLIEPTLMGAYEGAAITVLGKGVTAAQYQTCIVNGVCDGALLTNSVADCSYTSNFYCNPSRIDGITFSNSSQGGGGIFLHGWNQWTEVSNNRVQSNAGTLTGGITIGQVEVPDGTIAADGVTQLPFNYNTHVNVHNNAVVANASLGDEINSTTPSSAGGVTFCTGADYYHFNYNWICGNISSGDGGGIAHFGFSYNGDISHNWVLFNQSNNPTLPTYGGGIIAQGVPPDGTFCENSLVDVDCAPELSEGVGPGLVIDSNLMIGNTAESGKGGGLRLQNVNGTDVQRSPSDPSKWHAVKVTNNIIGNNVAGWAGGGVSLQDAVNVTFINNTVISNDATATAGVLFNTDLATQANVGPPQCTTIGADTTCQPITTSVDQPAGLETAPHTGLLAAAFVGASGACPAGMPECTTFSNPVLTNNIFWQNRTFHILVGPQTVGVSPMQNVVTLNPALTSQTVTGACEPSPRYWDIGVADVTGTSPMNGGTGSSLRLYPTYSILTNASAYPTNASGQPAYNVGSNPSVISQYCNGSRVPPEAGGQNGIQVPPGIADAVLPNPIFSLTPSAVPDEGNNWINMQYGPLSLFNAALTAGSAGYNVPLGNYSIQSGSPAIGSATTQGAPAYDFFGTPRTPRQNGMVDVGAVEFTGRAP